MTEEQILNAIANVCEDDTLRFQIIIQDERLHVYINRPTQAELNYQNLKSKIYSVVTEKFPLEFAEIWLYCRVLGEMEADWQALLEIQIKSLDPVQTSSIMNAITGAVEATNSIVEKIKLELEIPEPFAIDWYDFEELPTTEGEDNPEFDPELLDSIDHAVFELDLNHYCFISNQRLLYAVLTAPKENIARLVDTFDRFPLSTKRSQLPVLEIYFHQSINPDLDTLEPAIKPWWSEITALDSDQQRQLAIWLSRYCLHPEQTISTISKVFMPAIEGKTKKSPSTIKSIRGKLFQPTPKQKDHNSKAKPGLFAGWLTFLSKLLHKVNPSK
ncbi:MAG: hypothetical protein RLZZ04_166 [Cyanobacteriota bacterium]|jgi:hypothetical protein